MSDIQDARDKAGVGVDVAAPSASDFRGWNVRDWGDAKDAMA
jgi:hypothetical protein